MDNAIRDVPSSKAREISWSKLRGLMHLLYLLDIETDYFSEQKLGINAVIWRKWIIKHTPPDKRGWTGDPKKDRAIKIARNL